MGSMYWIKLYHEVLDDPKMGQLSDHLWRRLVELFLMAGKQENSGALPSIADMCWTLRIDTDELTTDLRALEALGVVSADGDDWTVTNFAKRQAPVPGKVRQAEYRKRQHNKAQALTQSDEPCNVASDSASPAVTTEKSREDKNRVDIDFAKIRQAWLALFPEKPKPRVGNKSLQGKTATRMRQAHFRENWRAALERASRSEYLHRSSWFDLGWFLKNDDHYERCLDGKYDNATNAAAPRRDVKADIAAVKQEMKQLGKEGWAFASQTLDAYQVAMVKEAGGWHKLCGMYANASDAALRDAWFRVREKQ